MMDNSAQDAEIRRVCRQLENMLIKLNRKGIDVASAMQGLSQQLMGLEIAK